MLRPLDINIENAVAFLAAGRIVLGDVDSAINIICNKLRDHEELALYLEVESFKGISMEALMRDIRFAIPHRKRFNKKAVVTERPWMHKTIDVVDKFFPGMEVRHFDPYQKFQAKTWLAGELA